MALIETIPIPLFLYAETHFRFFKSFPSLLFRREPEIVFDMPARVRPGYDVHIVLIINDIDKFPLEILEVTLAASQEGSSRVIMNSHNIEECKIMHPLSGQCSVFLFRLDRQEFRDGELFINGNLRYKIRGRIANVLNDNFAGASHAPLRTFLARENLPGSTYCQYADLHVHSQFSQSHVEFGAPITVVDEMAHSYGTSVVGVTNHSYDLSCKIENYLESEDSTCPARWLKLRDSLEKTNSYKTRVIAGEEISCRNLRGKTVHLGGLGLKDFIPGAGDGARRNAIFKKDLDILASVKEIHRQNGVAFAAHPGARCGFMQRIFLHRGSWSLSDLPEDLDGFQAVNGSFSKSWHRARAMWVQALLLGKRLALLAGNDSHGDFNRYRNIAIPFLLIGEAFDRHLCRCLTGIYQTASSSSDPLLAIREGRTFVTNGPFLGIGASASDHGSAISNRGLSLNTSTLFISIESTYEFGVMARLRVFRGNVSAKKESLVVDRILDCKAGAVVSEVPLSDGSARGYFRAEVECRRKDGTVTRAATSPCYLQ